MRTNDDNYLNNEVTGVSFCSDKEGISMVGLVITIVVLIIIAGFGFAYSRFSIKEAGKAEFFQEVSMVRERKDEKIISNQMYGTGETIENKGFYKTKIENPPINFISFSDEEVYGYVVDLDVIDFRNEAKRGLDYKRYSIDEENNIVYFGEDDVYVYDKEGNTFYAKGYGTKSEMYYTTDDANQNGPVIVSIEKEVAPDEKSVNLIIVVKKANNGILNVAVDGESASKTGENGNEETFEFRVQENKTYIVSAIEEGAGISTSTVTVSEINALTYVITYDANGGINSPAPQTKTENVPMRISKDKPTKAGSEFLGWSENATDVIATYRPNGLFSLNKNTTLYAIWTADVERTYSVTYNANGGNGGPLSASDLRGEYIISPVVPTREGYGFEGWSLNSNAITATYHPGDVINLSENVILYAVWQRGTKSVNIVVEPAGAGIVTGNGAKLPGGEVYISATAESGYVFKNWSVRSGGIMLGNTTSANSSFTMPNNDVELVANFEVTELTVRYDGNKGSSIGRKEKVNHGDEIIITTLTPIRNGYDFLGWSLNKNALTASYYGGDTFTVNSNVVFYAIWAEHVETYTVTYDLNGGTGNMAGDIGKFEPQTKLAGGKLRIPVGGTNEPYRKDFAFIGWGLTARDEIPVFNPGDEYSRDKSVTLYAIWKDNVVPSVEIKGKQETDGEKTYLVGNLYDEGKIAGYAWTMTNTVPSSWEYDGIGNKTLELTHELTTKGTHYLWAKDEAGNVNSASINVYEIKYLSDGGAGVPNTQYQPHEFETRLSSNVMTKNGFVFLGWTTSNTPGDTESSVEFFKGGMFKLNRDVVLKPVWGKTSFTLSANSGTSQIDGQNIIITMQKSAYTGNISVTSADSEIATGSESDGTITIVPGTKVGTVTLTIKEDRTNFSANITVTINKGIRKLTINETNKSFVYGDSNAQIGFSYRGKESATTVTSSMESVATASISGKNVVITPKNTGNAIITLRIAADDQYLEKTGEIAVTVSKRGIVVTPSNNITKIFDGTTSTPTITYTYTGQVQGESPAFSGSLTRESGANAGKYKIGIGTLELIDNGKFKKSNYELLLKEGTFNFEILPLQLSIESISATVNSSTSRVYTGNPICPGVTIVYDGRITLVEGTDYTLEYSNNINIGTATITIKGKGNYSGTLTRTFTITKATMQMSVTGYTGTFDNAEHEITVSQTWPTTGNTIYYSTSAMNESNYRSVGSTTNIRRREVGETTVYVYIVNPNCNDYTGNAKITIGQKSMTGNISIQGITNKQYTGSAITQNITVRDNSQGRNLTQGVDYNVSYSNNTNVGTATVRVSGIGNYTGTVTENFTITGDTVTLTKSTEALVTSLTVSMSKVIGVTKLEYKIDNGSWTNYSGAITITRDCTVYGRSVHNGNVIGSNQITITNICEHQYSDATCTTESRCVHCNLFNRAALGHNGSEATCTAASVCSRCNVTLANALGHNGSTATCTAASVCSRCNETVASALGHNWGAYTRITAATCTTAGKEQKTCSRCNDKSSRTLDALGHYFNEKNTGSDYLAEAAACRTPATYYYKCTRCTSHGTSTFVNGNFKGHRFTNFTVMPSRLKVAATCTTNAVYWLTCNVCNASAANGNAMWDIYIANADYETGTFEDPNTALGHDAPNATCTSASVCSKCKAKLAGALGHNFSKKDTSVDYRKSPATCESAAVYYYRCSRCTAKGTSTFTAGSPNPFTPGVGGKCKFCGRIAHETSM